VSGTASTDFQGDTSEKYQVTLQFLNGKREVVGQGEILNENDEEPSTPFILAKTRTHLFLVSSRQIYLRPLARGAWRTWNYRDDASLPGFSRAIMPSRYAHNEKFEPDWVDELYNNRLPEVPSYKFERWNVSSRLVVMHQDGTSQRAGMALFLWPKRLVFRSLPSGVRVELLKMSLPDGDYSWWGNELDYEKARQVPGGHVLGREVWNLSPRLHTTQLASWWSAKGKTVFQLRGLCADPNSKLLHFGWQIASGQQQWAIAYNNKWVYIREADCALQSPYLFVRFSWPKRQTHSTNDLPRPRRHHAIASHRSGRHDAVFRRAVR
jgi:hypothetical protein